MTYRIVAVQFAIPHDDQSFNLSELKDEIQEALFDERGMSGSFIIVGAKDESGNEEKAILFQDQAFDGGTVIANASEILAQESEARGALWYEVHGVGIDGTLSPQPGGSAPFEIFDMRAQAMIPGKFKNRAMAEAQAERMNEDMRESRMRCIAIQKRDTLSA